LLVKHLDHVATTEGVRVEPEGIELLARTAAGGARDAISLLDQALAYAGTGKAPDAPAADGASGAAARGGTVSARQIQAMLGLTDTAAVNRLVDTVLGQDLPGAIRVIHTVSAQGSDLRQFARQVLEFLRAMLLTASDAGSLLQLDEDTQDAVQQRTGRVSLSELVRLIKLISQAEQGLKSPAAQPQLPLELAVVEAVLHAGEGAPEAAAPRAHAAAPTAGPSIARAAAPQSDPVPAASRAPAPIEPGPPPTAGPEASPVEGPPTPPTDEAPPQPPAARPRTGAAPAGPAGAPAITLELVQERWTAVLRAVRQTSRPVEALLRDATPIGVEDGNVVVLQFRYAIHCNKVNEPANLIAAKRALSRTLGAECRLRCVAAETGGSRGDRPRSQAGMSDPVVVKAMRIWRAQVLSPAELAAVEAVPIVPLGPLAAMSGAFPGKD
jgi:DNA polymerase-3 subunit gamma/tau